MTNVLSLDMTNLSSVKIEFAQGEPFKPLEQLLGVLPAASRSFLPPPFRVLMVDVDSPLQKYYPLEFELDMNGKKNDWEAIVVIPYDATPSLCFRFSVHWPRARLSRAFQQLSHSAMAILLFHSRVCSMLTPGPLQNLNPRFSQFTKLISID